jgi:hypothetical protein
MGRRKSFIFLNTEGNQLTLGKVQQGEMALPEIKPVKALR